MADDPVFPPPEPRGGYRERQERPVTAVESVTRTSRPIVAKRPESDAPARRARRDEEVRPPYRQFMARNSFAYRHPRVVLGGFLTAVGVSLIAMSMNGTHKVAWLGWWDRSGSGGPFALAIGLFILAFGIQRGADHEPTRTWKTALVVCTIVGGLGGMILLSMLSRR